MNGLIDQTEGAIARAKNFEKSKIGSKIGLNQSVGSRQVVFDC